MPDGDAPARPERQVLAHAAVLEPHRGQDVGIGGRLDAGVSDREPADAPRREDVAVEQGRRHREDVGHVVEAEVRVVGRQQGRGVDVERQQIAHRVGVLPAVQPVDGGAARIGVGGSDAVEGRLQRRGDGGVGSRLGPRPARRRHRPRAQLPDDLLPRRGMVAHPDGVHRVEGEPRRQQALVVAGDAVAVEDRADRLGRTGLLRRGLAGRPGGAERSGCFHPRFGSRCRRRQCTRRRGGVSMQIAGPHHRDEDADDACCPGSRHRLAIPPMNDGAAGRPRDRHPKSQGELVSTRADGARPSTKYRSLLPSLSNRKHGPGQNKRVRHGGERGRTRRPDPMPAVRSQ